MAFNYSKVRDTAKRIITNFGGAGQVIKKGIPSGGFDDNGDSIAATADVTISGIITPLLRFKKSEIDGSAIQTDDTFVFFHSDTAPEIDMQITLNSKTFRIIDIVTLSSVDDINVFRRLQLRI